MFLHVLAFKFHTCPWLCHATRIQEEHPHFRSGSNNRNDFRTYLDGGDYVGAAAAAAGKLCLGQDWKGFVLAV